MSNKLATKADLQEMYSRLLPYLGGTADAGFTPVGTIIAVMGNSAPVNYLACNGQVVNIADYPELANYFEQQFGSKSKFGGNGTTTFGIPDLRGEFLRGTGTNSHANQGNGDNVGTHQDGTEIPYVYAWNHSDSHQSAIGIDIRNDNVNTYGNLPRYSDSNIYEEKGYLQISPMSWVSRTTGVSNITSRPTNTSVLYCIATKNIYLNPSLDYSTDEKVVGHWIDGKPLYQKTFVGTISNSTGSNIAIADLSSLNISKVLGYEAFDLDNTTLFGGALNLTSTKISDNKTETIFAWWNLGAATSSVAAKTLYLINTSSAYVGRDLWVTLRYTKTTD